MRSMRFSVFQIYSTLIILEIFLKSLEFRLIWHWNKQKPKMFHNYQNLFKQNLETSFLSRQKSIYLKNSNLSVKYKVELTVVSLIIWSIITVSFIAVISDFQINYVLRTWLWDTGTCDVEIYRNFLRMFWCSSIG